MQSNENQPQMEQSDISRSVIEESNENQSENQPGKQQIPNTFGQKQLNTNDFKINVRQFDDESCRIKETNDNSLIRGNEAKISNLNQIQNDRIFTSSNDQCLQQIVSPTFQSKNNQQVRKTLCSICLKLEPFQDLIRPCLCIVNIQKKNIILQRQTHRNCLKQEIRKYMHKANSSYYDKKLLRCFACQTQYLISKLEKIYYQRIFTNNRLKLYIILQLFLFSLIIVSIYGLIMIAIAGKDAQQQYLKIVFLLIVIVLFFFVIISFLGQEMIKIITEVDWQICDILKRDNLITVEMLNVICPIQKINTLESKTNLSTTLPLQFPDSQLITQQ